MLTFEKKINCILALHSHFLSWKETRSSEQFVFCTKYFSSFYSIYEFWSSIPLPDITVHTPVLGKLPWCEQGTRVLCSGRFCISAQSLPCALCLCFCESSWATSRVRVAMRPTTVLQPPATAFSTLLQHKGWSFSSSMSCSVFFQRQKKIFILIIKISPFCILQYISNISTMRHEWVQHGQEAYNLSQRWKLRGWGCV